MDGGINNQTIKQIPGLDMVVSGSYICKANNYEEQILYDRSCGFNTFVKWLFYYRIKV